ncbi:DNA gyrase subunit A [Iocasia frigidifontis]|uniref:DNA topoisomerase (ATP-hydrolyzing) n=1 Tax=Iocasia fonsfrigidae TaxID=2682810 RepID=A0A8A7KF63_9FIRM|nr:DNA gyrase subunit A [Iocasia fonsfrigidae]QTL98328.1 DNA gyrase subunit A [Iocasia fonsfrigidae]
MTEKITPIAIEDKMRESYLNYSLSVIASRALPDVRDGLKPVHRRILYAAREISLFYNKPHKKSARVVGEVLGKYHPHGDAAVYAAMVRMAQHFNQRYQLIDGHGNFGSIDGDSAAAMRYTEVRLTELAESILSDINLNTVDFTDNFDGSLQEPVILPSRIPNLLVNGASGIAVGMSTDIPPHNINETIDALLHLLKHPNARLETLMKYLPGPDFPTGAQIMGNNGIIDAYKTGKGKIILRAKTKIEKKGKKTNIIITEIPYQLNKSRLIEEIADLVNSGKIDGISDLRDETDQEGIRVVIELKANTDTELILNRLYKYSSMQTSYRINMLALVGQKPLTMNLRTILQHFIDFRRKVITRRTKHKLEKATMRHHILEGLIKAIDKMDLVISIIRNSQSTSEARKNLINKLKISQEQATAILEMQLQRLVGMETEKLLAEAKDLAVDIKTYQAILNNQDKLDDLLKDELNETKNRFSDKRRTEIIADEKKAQISEEDLIKDKDAIITFSYRQNIKRTNSKEYARTSKKDYITTVLKGSSLDPLLFFTNTGDVYTIPIHNIEEHHGLSTGESIKKYLKIPLKEKIVNIICLNEEIKQQYITITTKNGMVKKTAAKEYFTNYNSIKAINLKKKDEVVDVFISDGNQEIMLATKAGQTIRFNEKSVNDTGRNTMGKIGIKLEKNDSIVSSNLLNDNDFIIAISTSGKAKRTAIKEYKVQKRNGKGLKTCGSKIHQMSAVLSVPQDKYILIVSSDERLFPVTVKDITETQRDGNMFQLIDLNENEEITGAYILPVYNENNPE